MRRIHRVLLAGAALAALIGVSGTATAAAPPQVFSVVEGRDSATDTPVIVLIGTSLTKLTGYTLTDPLGVHAPAVPNILLRSKTMVVLGLPGDLAPGAYGLACTYGKADTLSTSVKIGNGAPLPGAVSLSSLASTLRDDLDDASTLGGQSVTSFHDASNVSAGTLDPARFSAYDDLVSESKIGTDAKQVAAGDHDHDKRYPLLAALSSVGTLNVTSNPMDWTKLKGVPAGFADGVDNDTTYSAGTGLALTGTTFSVASVGWNQLTGIPSGFGDGIDNDTTYTAGTGLTLTGTSFSSNFGGTGTATTAARSDHNHNATYLAITGGSMTGALSVTTNTANGASVLGTSSNSSGYGVHGASTSLTGFGAGLYGSSISTGGAGLYAEANATSGQNFGVYATSSSSAGFAVYADATSFTGSAIGVYASSESPFGRGVNATCAGTSSVGVYGETTSGTGSTIGAWGTSASTSGTGVLGESTGATGATYGVHGKAASGTGYGVLGENTSTTGDAVGVAGKSSGPGGTGVFGDVTYAGGSAQSTYGVHGRTAVPFGAGVYGESTSTLSFGYGVFGQCASGSGYGIYGYNSSATGTTYGVYGNSQSSAGYGVYGIGFRGVEGASAASGGVGVWATAGPSAVPFVANNTSSSTTNSIAFFQIANVNKARIDQTGKGFFNGGTQSSGADFAESVAVAGPRSSFEPGDVIVIDTNSDRTFALSSDAESTLVAGVYSTKPGVLATPHDSAGDDLSYLEKEIPLAVVGIVPVKVCDEGGAIERGDLLVTASLPGHAKKAPKDPKAGTLLGKALGRLEKGEGRIEVYLVAR